jgi:hypothetical protein
MIISVTEREEYKRCRRRWDYNSSNRQSLQKISPSSAFTLGTLIHQAHADWVEKPDAEPGDLFLHHSIKMIEDTQHHYAKQVGAAMQESELEPLYDLITLGKAMMENYKAKWLVPLPRGYDLVSPEQEFVVPIPGTEHGLKCKLDAIIRDRNNLLYVLERKTYGNRPKLNVIQESDQFLAYTWALAQLSIGSVGGLAYDGMWKREVPPKGSTLDDLFVRHILQYPHQQLEEFEYFLALEAEEMASCPPLYINRRWEGCISDCDFEMLCTAQSRGEDVDYIRKEFYYKREGEVLTDD